MIALPSVVVCVLLVLAPGSRQGPPSADEQKAFADGLRLFERGDARGAERAWKAGYAAGHDPAFLVRIGEAQEKAGAPEEAVRSYEQYLRDSPDTADRADVGARLRRLSPGTVRAAMTTDEEPAGEMSRPDGTASSPPRAVPSPAFHPRADSHQSRPEAAGAAPPPPPPPPPPGGVNRQVKDDDANEDLRAFVDDDTERSRLNVAGWVGAGVTALVLGAAAFYGAKAAEKAGDANRLLLYADEATGVPQEYGPHARQYEDIVREGQRDDRIAKGLVVAAGVTAAVSAVLLIVDATRSDRGARRTRKDVAVARAAAAWAATGRAIPSGGAIDVALGMAWRF